MKTEVKEIINALKLIQNICQRSVGCDNCPFSKNETCVLQDQAPIDWKITEPIIIWKAFE